MPSAERATWSSLPAVADRRPQLDRVRLEGSYDALMLQRDRVGVEHDRFAAIVFATGAKSVSPLLRGSIAEVCLASVFPLWPISHVMSSWRYRLHAGD